MPGPPTATAPRPTTGPRPLRGGRRGTPAPERSIRPRRGLPGGRAVVGGLRVAVAALGTFAAITGADHGPTTRYVVAAHDLRVGTVLTAADLGTVAVELPGPVERAAYPEGGAGALLGHVVVAPLARGSLVPVGAVARTRGHRVATFTVAVPTADALGGGLRPGDEVDVYVTFGTGTASKTRRIAGSVTVVGVDAGGSGVGDAGKAQVTLALADPSARIEVVNAAHAGAVSLARSGGPAAGGSDPSASTFAESDAVSAGASSGADDAAPTRSTTTRPGQR